MTICQKWQQREGQVVRMSEYSSQGVTIEEVWEMLKEDIPEWRLEYVTVEVVDGKLLINDTYDDKEEV